MSAEMEDGKHSPEPWIIRDGTIFADDEWPVADSVVGYNQPDDPAAMTEANKRRIVACVNFCREFSTEFLEQHTLKYLSDGTKNLGELPGFTGLIACVKKGGGE